MKRSIFLAVLFLSTAGILTGCMSPEQLAETAKKLKERREELAKKNPEVQAVYAKHDLAKGAIVKVEDVEERTVHQAEVPVNALHEKRQANLKKVKNDLKGGAALTQQDVGELSDP